MGLEIIGNHGNQWSMMVFKVSVTTMKSTDPYQCLANTPDLTPLYYFLCGFLKGKAFTKEFNNPVSSQQHKGMENERIHQNMVLLGSLG